MSEMSERLTTYFFVLAGRKERRRTQLLRYLAIVLVLRNYYLIVPCFKYLGEKYMLNHQNWIQKMSLERISNDGHLATNLGLVSWLVPLPRSVDLPVVMITPINVLAYVSPL